MVTGFGGERIIIESGTRTSREKCESQKTPFGDFFAAGMSGAARLGLVQSGA